MSKERKNLMSVITSSTKLKHIRDYEENAKYTYREFRFWIFQAIPILVIGIIIGILIAGILFPLI